MDRLDTLRPALEAVDQSHILAFADDLAADEREAFAAEIEAIDLAALPALIERFVLGDAPATIPDDLEPAPYFPLDGGSGAQAWDVRAHRRIGEDLIEAGKVACFTVAGGQGSRLGYDGPKGCYPAGCVTGKSLFEIFAEKIRGAERAYEADIPWYIMTSPLNDAATRQFFARNAFFGLDESRVMFFEQGTMPSFDAATGRLLLADKGQLATNPDGHGGAIRALMASGAVEDMKRRGVAHISYFQVDNPSVAAVDPVFLGLHAGHARSSGQMSSKMVAKAGPEEKVGVFAASGGKLMVVEYSDLPEALAHATDEAGNLLFNAGSIAIHLLAVSFVERLATDAAFALPFHRAVKKVPFVDAATGERVEPIEPNAVKLERFIFDAIAMAESSIVMETDRVEEFAPIKNAVGADSIETSKRLQTEKAARWLEAAGVTVARSADGSADCVIELSGLAAPTRERLEVDGLPDAIEPGAQVAL
jgi:UDP-N-acetylglucosamine/UDP-N-acetylgalactosamine diphosphorylase